MDDQMKELVAMGAAAAANCHPCMDYHLAKCDKLGVPREEVVEAVKVGLMVNHRAEGRIRKRVRELLGDAVGEAGPERKGVRTLVDGVGFEPTRPFKGLPVFKTGAFNRSATHPGAILPAIGDRAHVRKRNRGEASLPPVGS